MFILVYKRKHEASLRYMRPCHKTARQTTNKMSIFLRLRTRKEPDKFKASVKGMLPKCKPINSDQSAETKCHVWRKHQSSKEEDVELERWMAQQV